MKKEKIKSIIKNRYIPVCVAFVFGVIIGAIKSGEQSDTDIISALEYNISVDNGQALCFSRAALQNLKITGIFWALGMTMAGAYVVPALIGLRGYAVGMSVGVLIKNYGFKGFLAASGGVLPHFIILVPVYIVMAVLTINYSNNLKNGIKNKGHSFVKYTFATAVLFLGILAGCFVEGYVSFGIIKSTI